VSIYSPTQTFGVHWIHLPLLLVTFFHL